MTSSAPNSFRALPDPDGHFGNFGGRFVAETLMPLILELEQAYKDAKADPAFKKEMDYYLKHYVGRANPLLKIKEKLKKSKKRREKKKGETIAYKEDKTQRSEIEQ